MAIVIAEKLKFLFNNKTKSAIILLSLIIIGLFFIYNYHNIITKKPQSVHAWRQSDCASQALNYAERNMNFLKPQIHCQVSEDYQSGYCVEEFPVVFYLVGVLHSIFGHIDFIFRAFNLLIFFIGLYYLFFLYKKTIVNNTWALFLTVFLFTSPLFVFYANNYILNTPAFALTLIGWFYFISWLESKKRKTLFLSFLLFTLASLLKISEMISIFTIAGILFLDYFRIVKFNANRRLITMPFLLAFYIIVALALSYLWYYYSHYYNTIHDQHYYYYSIRDIFSLTKDEIDHVKGLITDYWRYHYHNKISLYFMAITLLLNIIFIKWANRLFISITIIMFVGSVMFLLLFYWNLGDHDYYVISLFITIIFSLITFFDLCMRKLSQIIISKWVKLIFASFLIYSVSYADKKITERYDGWENSVFLNSHSDIYEIKPYLDEINIPYDAKVISIPDATPNLTLYLMNRLGWTNFIENDHSKLIPFAIERGAGYIVISDPAILTDEGVKPYLFNKIGQFRNASIFSLDSVIVVSSIWKPVSETVIWNMEKVSSDGKFIISDTLDRVINNTNLSDERSFSGKHSIKVETGDFALNYYEDNLIPNQRYIVQLKVFTGEQNNSSLIVCISSPEEFYRHTNKGIVIHGTEWKLFELEFTVPPETKNRTLSVDFHNIDEHDIFIDDFSIAKYTN